MRIIIGDIILPAVIQEQLEVWPYAVVIQNTSTGEYNLAICATPVVVCETVIGGTSSLSVESLGVNHSFCKIGMGFGAVWETADPDIDTSTLKFSYSLSDESCPTEIVWASHDIKKATRTTAGAEPTVTNEVYFADTSYVQYPPIPDEVLAMEDYPYISMVHNNMVIMEQYVLVASKVPLVSLDASYLADSAGGEIPPGMVAILADTGNMNTPPEAYSIGRVPATNSTGWIDYSLPEDSSTIGAVGSSYMEDWGINVHYDLLYANHDVKAITSVNEDGTYVVGDKIFFRNSETPAEPEPEYGKIRRQHMRDIGDAIRRKTGKKDKIPTPQLASEIDSIVTADNALVLKDNEKIIQFAVVTDTIHSTGLVELN